jgi:hypothetical protein
MATTGRTRRVYLTTKGGASTYTWLAGEQSNNFSLEAEMLEASDKSSDFRQYIPGIKGATADVTVFADTDSSSPQHQLISALYKGESVYVFIGTLGDGNTPTEGDMFEAYIQSISTPNELSGVVTRSITLQPTGEIEHLPAPTK